VKVDKAPPLGRRLLEDMIRREREDPTYCAPPAPVANDDIVTLPFAVAVE